MANSPSFKPSFEALEDRQMPSTVTPLWNVNAGGGGRFAYDTAAMHSGDVLLGVARDVVQIDGATGAVEKTFSGHEGVTQAVCESPDGTMVASAANDRTLRIRSIATGEEVKRINLPSNPNELVWKDGVIAVSLDEGGVLLVDAESGAMRQVGPSMWSGRFVDGGRGVMGLEWMNGNSIVRYNTASGAEEARLTGLPGDLTPFVAVNEDGTQAAVGRRGGGVVLYDVAGNKELRTLQGLTGYVGALSFTPGGMLLGGDGNGNIAGWDTPTGERILSATIDGGTDSIAVTVDGRRAFIVAQKDGGSSPLAACDLPEPAWAKYPSPEGGNKGKGAESSSLSPGERVRERGGEEVSTTLQPSLEATITAIAEVLTAESSYPSLQGGDTGEGAQPQPFAAADASTIEHTPISPRLFVEVINTEHASEMTVRVRFASPENSTRIDFRLGGGEIQHPGGTEDSTWSLKIQTSDYGGGTWPLKLKGGDSGTVLKQVMVGTYTNYGDNNRIHGHLEDTQTSFEAQEVLPFPVVMEAETDGRHVYVWVQSPHKKSYISIIGPDGSSLSRASSDTIEGQATGRCVALVIPEGSRSGTYTLVLRKDPNGTPLKQISVAYDGATVFPSPDGGGLGRGGQSEPLMMQKDPRPASLSHTLITGPSRITWAGDLAEKSQFHPGRLPSPLAGEGQGEGAHPSLEGGDQGEGANTWLLSQLRQRFPHTFPTDLPAELALRKAANPGYPESTVYYWLRLEQADYWKNYGGALDTYTRTLGNFLTDVVNFWVAIKSGKPERPLYDALGANYEKLDWGMLPAQDFLSKPGFGALLEEGRRLLRCSQGAMQNRQNEVQNSAAIAARNDANAFRKESQEAGTETGPDTPEEIALRRFNAQYRRALAQGRTPEEAHAFVVANYTPNGAGLTIASTENSIMNDRSVFAMAMTDISYQSPNALPWATDPKEWQVEKDGSIEEAGMLSRNYVEAGSGEFSVTWTVQVEEAGTYTFKTGPLNAWGGANTRIGASSYFASLALSDSEIPSTQGYKGTVHIAAPGVYRFSIEGMQVPATREAQPLTFHLTQSDGSRTYNLRDYVSALEKGDVKLEGKIITDGHLDSAEIKNGTTTWLVIHGMNSKPQKENIRELTSAVVQYAESSNGQAITINWNPLASDNILKYGLNGAAYVRSVAQNVVDKLIELNIDPSKLRIIGHSWGTFLAYEIARYYFQKTGIKISAMILIDSANNAANAMNSYPADLVRFHAFSQNEWAFEGSGLAYDARSKTARHTIKVEIANSMSQIGQHGYIVDAVTSIIKGNNTGVPNAIHVKLTLDTLLNAEHQKAWKDNGLSELVSDGYEAILYCAVAVEGDHYIVDAHSLQYIDHNGHLVHVRPEMSGPEIDAIGKDISSAKDLGVIRAGNPIGNALTATEWIGGLDQHDMYKFTVEEDGVYNILASSPLVRTTVLNQAGAAVGLDAQSSQVFLSAGTYFLNLHGLGEDITYTLVLRKL